MAEPTGYRCPICGHYSRTEQGRYEHLMRTKRHETAVEAILRLEFLLADREHALAVVRQQRDEARSQLQDAICYKRNK